MTQDLPPLVHQVNEAAKRLKISRATFYKLVSAGDISPIKVGGRTLVAEEELQRYVSKQVQRAKRGAGTGLSEVVASLQGRTA